MAPAEGSVVDPAGHRGSAAERERLHGLKAMSASVVDSRGAWMAGNCARSAIAAVVSTRRDVRAPIFLWGAGRTGSFLLYDLLSLHPQVVCLRWRRRKNKGLYGSEHWGAGDYDHLLKNPFPPQEGFVHHFASTGSPTPRTGTYSEPELAEVHRSYRRLAATTVRPRRLLDKSPSYTFVIPELERMFSDARHVHCVRHPRVVVNAYLRRMGEGRNVDLDGFWGVRPPGWEAVVDADADDKAVWMVTATMRHALEEARRLGPACVQVRYENLVNAPRSELARVLAATDLTPDNALLDRLPPSFPNFNKIPEPGPVDTALRGDLEQLVADLGYEG